MTAPQHQGARMDARFMLKAVIFVEIVMYPLRFLFPTGDNITMLATADWLLAPSAQDASGLS